MGKSFLGRVLTSMIESIEQPCKNRRISTILIWLLLGETIVQEAKHSNNISYFVLNLYYFEIVFDEYCITTCRN